MSNRFQIQDIVAQDKLGVLFRAIDTECGRTVGLRRFLPFGRDGGGLVAHELQEYQRGVAEMATLRHPALRTVLGGDCDPLDGIPYLVIEWIEGEPLSELLERGEFEPAAAVALLDRALQLCEAISATLGVEAMWLETSPQLVVLDGKDAGRGFTFALSPIRWLVATKDRHSLLPLASLAEELMGWEGRMVADHAGGGLGGWLRWVRHSSAVISLGEARHMLAHFTNPEAAAAGFAVTTHGAGERRPGTLTQPVLAATATRAPWLVALRRQLIWIGLGVSLVLLLVAAAGDWMVKHPRGNRTAHPRATATSRAVARGAPANVLQVADTEALLDEKGRTVVLEGVLKHVRATKATLYLEFAEEPDPAQVRGCILLKEAGTELTEESLQGLLDKRVRLTGVVRLAPFAKIKRPEVLVTDRKSIQEVP